MLYSFLLALLAFVLFLVARAVYFSRRIAVEPIDNPLPVNVLDAAHRLGKVIQFKTISQQRVADIDGDEFRNMHSWLEEAFPLVHQKLEKEVINEFSLLFKWGGEKSKKKPIMLTCHLDVVPVEPGTEDDWEYPPFDGKVTDEHIYGRGTMDVQSGVMAILEAVEHLLERGFEPDRTIYLGFGHDEEIDGEFGASEISRILESRGVELEYLLDEGLPVVDELIEGIKSPVALVAVAEKGFLSVELTVESEGGHSSVPQGKTAIAILSEAISRLENNPMPAKFDGLIKSTLTSLCAVVPYSLRLFVANLWLFKGAIKRVLSNIPTTNATLRTTTATTIFESGMKDNLIPTVAKSVVNFRIHPNDSVDSVLKHVKRTIENDKVQIRALNGYIDPSSVSDMKSDSFRQLRISIRQIFPNVCVSPTLMTGATDARHYTNLTSNIYRFSPLRAAHDDIDRVHGTNERISIENYGEMIQFYAQVIQNSAGSGD